MKVYRYTNDIRKASTFRSRFAAQEAVAELDGVPVGHCNHHRIETRGDGKFVISKDAGIQGFFADDISN